MEFPRNGLQPQHFALKTITNGNRRVVLITGGDDAGTRCGAYRFWPAKRYNR